MVASKAPQHNLPLQATSLIGRDKELVELVGAQNKTRLLTLIGVGGVGKTRLALGVAERVSACYADGTWLVDLAPLADAALVAHTVARVVSVPLAPGDDPAAALVNYFRPRQSLLILDNCEHLLTGCATLVDALLLRCAHLQILATSREPLGVAGELHQRVPSFAVPPDEPLAAAELRQYAAVELFVTRVQAALPHFSLTGENAQTVGRICARLDGIPLALELAAGRARSLPLDVIADRLHDSFHLLTSGKRTTVPRQQTLAATIGWSHDLLMDDERRLFRRLSVFAGGWTAGAAERFCGPEDSANSDVLRFVFQPRSTVSWRVGYCRSRLLLAQERSWWARSLTKCAIERYWYWRRPSATERLAWETRRRAERLVFVRLTAALTDVQRAQLDTLLVVQPGARMTMLATLRQPPRRPTPATFMGLAVVSL